MINESDATPHSRDEWTHQYAAAQRLKEDVQQLNILWQHYALPVQSLLTTLLTRFGLEAAALVTTALERQEHRRQMMLTLTAAKHCFGS